MQATSRKRHSTASSARHETPASGVRRNWRNGLSARLEYLHHVSVNIHILNIVGSTRISSNVVASAARSDVNMHVLHATVSRSIAGMRSAARRLTCAALGCSASGSCYCHTLGRTSLRGCLAEEDDAPLPC